MVYPVVILVALRSFRDYLLARVLVIVLARWSLLLKMSGLAVTRRLEDDRFLRRSNDPRVDLGSSSSIEKVY